MSKLDEINLIFRLDGTLPDILFRLRNSTSDFARSTLSLLEKKSPLSLCVTFESLKRGQNLTLKEALMMELKVFMGFLSKDDCNEMFEGVRALLVDKDEKPAWKHKTVSEVT